MPAAIKYLRRAISALLLTAALAACERRSLEYYYRPTCRVVLNVDWSHLTETPTGMSAFFYKDGGDVPIVINTDEVNSTGVDLPEGHWKCFVMNYGPDEYFYFLEFAGMYGADPYGAEAFLRQTRSRWYVSSKADVRAGVDASAVGFEPENLAIALAEEFDITKDMVEKYQAQYADWKTKTKTKTKSSKAEDDVTESKNRLDGLTYYINTVAYSAISELNVRVYIQGIYNLYSARASMDGLAENYLLYAGHPGTAEVVQLLESETWVRTVDSSDPTKGYIENSIKVLGLPGILPDDLSTRAPELNTFGLSCLLVDRTTQCDFDFPVGDKFSVELGIHGIKLSLNLVLGSIDDPGVTLPDVPPAGDSSGGMDAVVDDWETGETVEIPM